MLGLKIDLTSTTSYQILSNSLFTNHVIYPRYSHVAWHLTTLALLSKLQEEFFLLFPCLGPINNSVLYSMECDRLCGLVVRVPDYRSGGPRGSIPGHYKKKKVVGLERGPLSLVSTTEKLLGRNSSGSGLEIREYWRRDSSHSVGTVRLRTEATEFCFVFLFLHFFYI
jgi:hypothetical protein